MADRERVEGSGPDDEPFTADLLQELLSSSDPVAFARRNRIGHRSLSSYLNDLLERKGLRRVDVVRAAGMNETHGYQVFQGTRGVTRDKALCLALALRCDLLETHRLLQAAGANDLYCKDRRDAIIIFCIDRGLSLQQVDEQLYRLGERTLER